MGLVYREEGEGQGGQRVPEAGDVQAFRRNIEEIERAFAQRRMHGAPSGGVEGTVERGGPQAVGAGGVHLILHERDEGADHHADAVPEGGGKLEAEAFAAARGHDRQRVPPVEDAPDDVPLLWPEGRIAENPSQGREKIGVVPRFPAVQGVHRSP